MMCFKISGQGERPKENPVVARCSDCQSCFFMTKYERDHKRRTKKQRCYGCIEERK